MAPPLYFLSNVFRVGLDNVFGLWYNNIEYNTYGGENDLKEIQTRGLYF